MNAEFNWWLLIVGLVVGAGLTWFVLTDARRREVDIDEVERPRRAAWLSAALADEGHDVTPEAVDRLLTLNQAYLEAPPPDDPPTAAAAPSAVANHDPSEGPHDDRLGIERRASDVGQ